MRTALLAALSSSSCAAPPCLRRKEWYDLLPRGLATGRGAGKCAEAIAQPPEARSASSRAPALNEQTYGLEFVDYLPYYQQGVCQLRLGDYNTAIRCSTSRRSRARSRRADALPRAGQAARGGRAAAAASGADAERRSGPARACEEVQAPARGGGRALHKEGKLEEALTRLAQAQKAAEALDAADPAADRSASERSRSRPSRTTRQEQARRARSASSRPWPRAAGCSRRAARRGQLRFDEVLALDPRNAGAAEGSATAEERILASPRARSARPRFREGRALFEAGQYEEALQPPDRRRRRPATPRPRALLQKAQQTLEGVRQQKDLRQRIDALLAEGERLLAERKYPEAR